MRDNHAKKARENDKIKIPAKASFYYVMSTVIGKGAGLIVTPIFTRAMDTAEFGAYSYYISVLSVVLLVSGVFLSPSVIYSGLGKFRGEKSSFENSTILLTSAITTAICAVLFTFNGFFGISRAFIAFIFLQILFDSIVTAELLSGKFSYDYTKVVTINLLSAFLSPIISLFLIFRYDLGATGRILGLLIASGALAIALMIKRFNSKGAPMREHASFLLKNSIPLIPGVLARASLGWSDKLIIKGRLGVEALAKYSIAHTVGMALFGIIGALSSAINPWMIRKLSYKQRDSIFPVITNLTELISFGTVFIIGLAPEIFSFLAPSSYGDSMMAIIPFAISTVPYFLFGVSSVFITYSEKTKFISAATLLGAILNLGLNIFLIPRLGFMGGAVSYLASETVIYLLSLYLLGRCDDNAKANLGSTLPVLFPAAFALLMPILYEYLALRLLVLILPAVLMVNRGFRCLALVREKNT